MSVPTVWVTLGSYGGIHDLTNTSVENLPMLRDNLDFGLERREQCNVPFMRNDAAVEMVESNADYHLFIDRDMVFVPDDVWKLYTYLQNDKIHVISGLYIKTKPPYTPNVTVPPKEKGKRENVPKLVEMYRDLDVNQGLIPVDGVGTGFMMIKREVYTTIPFPWFETYYNENASKVSSDVAFCRKVREHGMGVYLATDIMVGHIGWKIFTWHDWLQIKESVIKLGLLETFEEKKIKRPHGWNISVIIPYRNMLDSLGRCVDSILPQLVEGDEIIITEDDIEFSLKNKFNDNGFVKKVFLKNENYFRFGSSLNAGFNAAKNDIVMIVGCDVTISDYLIASHLKRHLHHKGDNLMVNSRVDMRKISGAIEPDYRIPKVVDKELLDWRDIKGTGLSFSKKWALDKISENGNLFDPAFDEHWGYDDNELAFRAQKNGTKIVYDWSSRIVHEWHQTGSRRDRSINMARFVDKYPYMRGKLY